MAMTIILHIIAGLGAIYSIVMIGKERKKEGRRFRFELIRWYFLAFCCIVAMFNFTLFYFE